MQEKITFVIADDHEIFRDGLALMLSRQENLRLLGQAGDGRELVRLAEETRPSMVLTDIKMPNMDGIAATRALLEKHPDCKIIALSMFEEERLIVDMLEAGAKGYLLKNADKKEILEAIETVNGDNVFYCRQTSARLAALIDDQSDLSKKKPATCFTEREKEIITLICQQRTAQEIGDRIFLSKRTVEGYRTRILEKMDAKNTAGVVVFALKHHLINEGDLPGR